jgi:SMI1/KNR4 family protein SUKH-1
MNSDENSLVERLRERIRDPKRFIDVPEAFPHQVYPPVSLHELAAAEQRLEFQLPPLLRKLYLEIGNGGFGPGFGLLGLNGKGAKNYHMNLVDWYLERVNATHPDYPPWPRQFITICDWGDSITSELDWTQPDCPIFRFNGDRYEVGPFENVMKLEALSLRAWLEGWLSGQSLFELGRL